MKHTLKSVRTLAATLITFGSLAGGANAAIVATFVESAGDVILLATGSVDLTGLSNGSNNLKGGFGAWFGQNGAYGSFQGPWDNYNGGTMTVSGTWPGSGQISGVGSTLGIQDNLELPAGYVSNSDINSVFSGFVISGATFAGLGLTQGSLATYSWDSGVNGVQSVTIQVGAIPEPTSALLLGLGALSLTARRRRK